MSRSNGTKAVSLIAALLLCMVLMQTAFAAEDVIRDSNLKGVTAAGTVLAGNVTAEAGDSNTEIVSIDEPIDPVPANNQVDPSFDTEYILAGNKVSLTASFINKGNETLTVTPKLVGMPNSQHNISESWVTISPASATVDPGSVQKFEITESIPRDVDTENYIGQIAFTDDLVPNSTDYVNSLRLSIFAQAQPKLELQTTYISDNVQAGKEYVYRVSAKNIAAKDVTIDPKLNNYNSGFAQAFNDDAIEISAPSTIKAGESANLTIKVKAPENATGSYYGSIDMRVNGKTTSDGSNSQIGLSFNVWQQPVNPFVKSFSTKTNDPITIEISADNYNTDMGVRISPAQEKPSFKLELTRNSKKVKLNSVKLVDSGTVNIGGSPIIPFLDSNIYQNYNGHYAETYTVPGATGDWKLTILPKNTNTFGYSITFGDANWKK